MVASPGDPAPLEVVVEQTPPPANYGARITPTPHSTNQPTIEPSSARAAGNTPAPEPSRLRKKPTNLTTPTEPTPFREHPSSSGVNAAPAHDANDLTEITVARAPISHSTPNPATDNNDQTPWRITALEFEPIQPGFR
jgi:hypothetical protein